MNELALRPAENIALTVARSMLARGENPGVNVTAVLVLALDRFVDAMRADESAFHAGLILLKADRGQQNKRPDPRCDGLDAPALAVLSAMASFVAKAAGQPECFATVQRIVDRTRLGHATVKRALIRLEKLGLIERVGQQRIRGRGHSVRWRLLLLEDTPSTVAETGGW